MHFLKAVWIFIFIFCLQGAAFVLTCICCGVKADSRVGKICM